MTAAPDRRWPPAWSAGLVREEVDPAGLLLALEAAGWPRELPVAQRRAFALLVLASCEARREGSTRLALDGALEPRLVALGAAAADQAEALALAAARLAHPALDPLVGRPGARRPFILDGTHLYQERDLRLEQRVADALNARMAASIEDAASRGALDLPRSLQGTDPRFVEASGSEAGEAPSDAGRRGSEPGSAGGAPAEAALARSAPPAGRTWTAGQAAAIAAATNCPLTVVTGGPGSGKTAVIAGIVRAWRAAGVPAPAIAVAAPTGKAAHRAAEALAAAGADLADVPAPSTLHRLLGYSPRAGLRGGEVRHHPNNPLPHAALVVDEASMVDLGLLDRLLRALRPEARLALVGDAGQLPAIAAGSVFRDLAGIAIRLTESHRMSPGDPAGAEILAAARGIAAGEPPAGAALTDATALRFRGFERLDPGAAGSARRGVGAFLDRWYAEQVRLPPELDPRRPLRALTGRLDGESGPRAGALLERHRRARLLTVTRVGRAGADRINDELARRAAADLGSGPARDGLPPGTPVMVVENDYERGLMNGDQGAVLPVVSSAGAPVPTAVFARDDGFALFPLATLRGLVQIAYAITVHKAQGSEVERAALLLPEADLPLLSRELIYTAATRARASMVVVGRPSLLAEAIARPLGRTSGLADRLRPVR